MKKIITLCLIFIAFNTSKAQTKYKFNLLDSSITYRIDQVDTTLTPQFKYEYTYDNSNLLKTKKLYYYYKNVQQWVGGDVDSFFYDSNRKLNYIVSYFWDNLKLKLVKSDIDFYNYDINDSLIFNKKYQVDSIGNLILCGFHSRVTKYYPTQSSKCNFDSSLALCTNYLLDSRDSIVYNSNGSIKETYYSDTYYGFYGIGGVAQWDIYSYNQFHQLNVLLSKSFNGTTNLWDTAYRDVYLYNSLGMINFKEYWDPGIIAWVNLRTDSVISYKSIIDRFSNVTVKRNEEWINGSFYSYDSTHYYYHIPSCLSYYTTDYDTLTNSFNLTLDSITNTQAIAYHWDFGDGNSSNIQYPSHTYLVDTTYNVCLTIYKSNGDSCTYCHIIGKNYQGHIIKSAGFNLNVKGQGNINVNEIVNGKAELVVYPNPCNDKLLVTSYQLLVNTIEVTDVLGRILLVRQAHHDVGSHAEERSISIDVTNYPSGLYFLKATDEKGNSYNAKFVKQ